MASRRRAWWLLRAPVGQLRIRRGNRGTHSLPWSSRGRSLALGRRLDGTGQGDPERIEDGPHSPCESRPGETEPSHRVDVSWSGSKERATHTRAPPFQRGRPARIFSTPARQRLSSQAQDGSRSGSCGLMAPMDSPADAAVKSKSSSLWDVCATMPMTAYPARSPIDLAPFVGGIMRGCGRRLQVARASENG